jgi:hypothetical protein
MTNVVEFQRRSNDCDEYRDYNKSVYPKKQTQKIESLPEFGLDLDSYKFSADIHSNDNGDTILVLNEIDCLIETGVDEKAARLAMGKEILQFADDYFQERWYNTKWRCLLPYVLKTLFNGDPTAIGDEIICHHGNN